MTSRLSLHNKTVLNPRGKNSAKSFSKTVEKYGGKPVEIPLLAFKQVEPTSKMDVAMQNIHRYDWVILTSKTAVETFLSYWADKIPELPKIAVIGKKTAQVLEEKGVKVGFVPTEYVAEIFVKEFSPHIKGGTRVLIPKGNLARTYISDELIKLGAEVDELIIYETYFPLESKETLAHLLSENKIEIIPFTSPSTVDHFMEVVEKYGLSNKIKACIFAAIGPIAQKRAESRGLTVHVMPATYTVQEMLKSIAEYIEQ